VGSVGLKHGGFLMIDEKDLLRDGGEYRERE